MEIVPPDDLEASGDIVITEEDTRPYKRLTGFRQWSDEHEPVGHDTA